MRQRVGPLRRIGRIETRLTDRGRLPRWRRTTVRRGPHPAGGAILDVCTGTGDLALAYARAASSGVHVVASDFCRPSLPIVLGFTGAPYGVRLLEVLLEAGREVHLAVSPSGQAVLATELGRSLDLDRFDPAVLLGKTPPAAGRLHYHHFKNLMAPITVGS